MMPQQESPVRVYKQLEILAHALCTMQQHETGRPNLSEEQIQALEWCAYSLGSEERRTILKSVIEAGESKVTVRDVSAYMGLDSDIVQRYLSELTAIGITEKHTTEDSGDNRLKWSLCDFSIKDMVVRLDNYTSAFTEEDNIEF